MSRPSFSRRLVLAVAGGLLFSSSAVSHAAALTAALNEIAPKYEEASGNKLDIGYSLSPISESACWPAKPRT
jgi:ABC-type molybdate transport system substrate-binding protein